MDKQLNTALEFNAGEEILRDLLDSEIVLIGGGEAVGTAY